jgi:hypothetical protein
MPITFTEGLTPNFPDDSFGSEKQHVRSIYDLLDGGTSYSNPLEPALSNLVSSIDTVTTQLETDYNIAESEKPTLEGYATTPIDPITGQPEVDPTTGEDLSNLPDGWDAAGFTENDITNIVSAINGYQTENQLITTNLGILKTFITTADDTFKLHNDLLSGVRQVPPPNNIKPNVSSLMGIVSSITSLENSFGIPFTNYLELVFGTLFTGDVTISDAQALLDTDPIPTTYASLGVLSQVDADPNTNSPSQIITDINNLLNGSVYATTVLTHKDTFETHITDDTNEYDIILDKLDRLLEAFGVSGYFSEPYYKFMYSDVFGSTELKQIIIDLDNGDIT